MLFMRLEQQIGRAQLDQVLATVARRPPRYTSEFLTVLRDVAGDTGAVQAMQLIRYMKQPEREERLAQLIPTGLASRKAIAAVDPALKLDTPSNPDNMRNAVELDAQFWVEHSDQLTQRFNAWADR